MKAREAVAMWISRLRARTVLERLHVRIVYAIIITLAAGAYFGATGQAWSPTTRYHIIVGVLVMQTAGIIMLIHKVFDLLLTLRSTHRAATYVNTLRGLWATLEIGTEADSLSIETRKAIHKAGVEQFRLYDREIGGKGWH